MAYQRFHRSVEALWKRRATAQRNERRFVRSPDWAKVPDLLLKRNAAQHPAT